MIDWNPKMILSSITAGGGVVVMLWQGGNWVDTRYAHQEDLELVGMQMQQHNDMEWVRQIQARIWQLEDRYGGPGVRNAPDSVKEEYRSLQAQLAEAQRRLDLSQERMEQMNK